MTRASHPLVTNPDKFIEELLLKPDWFSLATAEHLDRIDPLNNTTKQFNIGDLVPFAGHSLGPVFQPALNKIQEVAALQLHLHEGHFPHLHPEGKDSGHWFDCDRHKPSLAAAKALLGFEEECEFIFTASGLSQNLAMLMETFYRPTQKDWSKGKTKIVMLATEFFSDQAVAVSVLTRAIQNADRFHCFETQEKPQAENLIIKISPDKKGLFNIEHIAQVIQAHAHEIQMICLSEIVFSTGQRLDLSSLFSTLHHTILSNEIIVGLDLAHSVGNRPIDLKSLPVTFAVGCGYKHLSGFAGSGFGIYVNKATDLKKYPPLQGWKAADADRVFASINHYDASIMSKKGAEAFRTCNPSPIGLIPTQTFLNYFHQIGFDKCFNKSECLTRYLIALLQHHLKDQLEFITPEKSSQRGAMIVFRIHGLSDVKTIENFLKDEHIEMGRYEIDVRPPNNIRLTAHYGYNTFEQINGLIAKLQFAIQTHTTI